MLRITDASVGKIVLMHNEQKLIDLCFEIGILISDQRYDFKNMDVEQRAEWIADQLRKSGFDTQPMGASWGVLK